MCVFTDRSGVIRLSLYRSLVGPLHNLLNLKSFYFIKTMPCAEFVCGLGFVCLGVEIFVGRFGWLSLI